MFDPILFPVAGIATSLFAFGVHKAIHGGGRTQDTPTDFERAERRLKIAGNFAQGLLLLIAVAKFAFRAGWLDQSFAGGVVVFLGVPLLIALAAYFRAKRDLKSAAAPAS